MGPILRERVRPSFSIRTGRLGRGPRGRQTPEALPPPGGLGFTATGPGMLALPGMTGPAAPQLPSAKSVCARLGRR